MTKPHKHGKVHLEWFAKAGEDELSIEAILKEGSPSTACFLSQQMAEKYLKGLVVFHKKSFPKVHDLLALETILLDCDPSVHQLHEYLKILNRYYIEARYPGDYPEFSKADADEAFQSALHVKIFALSSV